MRSFPYLKVGSVGDCTPGNTENKLKIVPEMLGRMSLIPYI